MSNDSSPRKPTSKDTSPKRASARAQARDRKKPAAARPGVENIKDCYLMLVQEIKDFAILILDPQGLVRSWNAGAERLKGYRSEEIIGKHFSIFYLREDVDRGKPEVELRVAAAEGRYENEGWRVRKDGARFWANVVVMALRDASGRLLGFGKVTRDLTERKRAEEEKAKLAANVREELLQGIRDAVNRLSSASTEILSSTQQQAAGAQEQAAAVAQAVATVDQVTQTANQAVQRAKRVGEAVQHTLEIGEAGRKAVEGSISAMSQLKEKIESTAESILILAEQAQAIGEIIATVNDIADQTNILALNAAIEASRAGEYGRGFAVVASEVKGLAEQSKKATKQVRQILGEIQKATNTSVSSTEEVTKGVTATSGMIGQAGETIKALVDTLDAAAQASAQIVASSGQQSTGMNQINQAMKNLDQVARQNLIATRQVEQAAQNLNALGTQLAQLTGVS